MAWLIIAAIVIVSLVFVAGYRKLAAGLVLASLLGGGLLYYYTESREEQARHRIPATEIALQNVELRHTFRSSYDLVGKVRNNSDKFRIDGIEFAVRMRDCTPPASGAQCIVIGEATVYATVAVPPQQVRDFTAAVYFGNDHVKLKGKMTWEYEVTAITARTR